jgi:predicted methyltransferase
MKKADVALVEQGAVLEDEVTVPWEEFERVAESDRKCYLLNGDHFEEIRVFSDHTGWVRSLCPTSGAPTMLVSGIPMHRIKRTEPWADTRSKLETVAPVKGRALDTATGLGYSAIQLSRTASEVVTIELDPAALEIARLNPWSRPLFDNPKITQIVGDAFEEVVKFPERYFSTVFHDPPTIQLAGELYSHEFYVQLRRVMTGHGKLFHYIGDPDSNLGQKVTGGVIRRLHEAGFGKVEREPEAFGVLAFGFA